MISLPLSLPLSFSLMPFGTGSPEKSPRITANSLFLSFHPTSEDQHSRQNCSCPPRAWHFVEVHTERNRIGVVARVMIMTVEEQVGKTANE